jgi:hypothetical protein
MIWLRLNTAMDDQSFMNGAGLEVGHFSMTPSNPKILIVRRRLTTSL